MLFQHTLETHKESGKNRSWFPNCCMLGSAFHSWNEETKNDALKAWRFQYMISIKQMCLCWNFPNDFPGLFMDWWCPDPQTRLNDNVRFSRGTLSKATTAASAERQRLVKKSQSTQPSEVVTISQYIWMSGNRLVWRKQVAIHIIYI